MFNSVRLNEKGLKRALGFLESAIMEIVWRRHRITVKELHRELSGKREIAYTTVMTVTDRLYKKGLLKRTKEQSAYVYAPACSRKEFRKSFVEKVMHVLFSDFKDPAISFFARHIDTHPEDARKLRELMKKIDDMKKEG